MRKKPEPEWTPELLAAAWKLVEDTPQCVFCGGHHARECPRVRRIAYYESAETKVREVEFWPHGEWPWQEVVFADLLPFPEEE